ncbi:MAG: two-component system response regulator [Candidatus Omnitrophica bacterium CG07_land_8_20_14_0_80_42_15]|uniref:Two-component system response regulator n=1 Tax=Candidatus Aquitaenariimonas noxiae TaxID=1974741 RepID=A0A2J0L0W6_9BACT|nr:MAG: two-component system response regulator [Candidatus Omnitrophica bacterium CG07_land_8_20_14_0_80_42_15]
MDKNSDIKVTSKPMNILLAEDNEADVKITLRAFSGSKFKNNIYVVKNGQEVLDFIYNCGKYQDRYRFPAPHLVILDINMPGVDGFGVLEKLKKDPKYNFIPIIMLTSSKDENDVLRSYKSGANSFIQKPLDYKEFAKIVDGFSFYWCHINRLPSGA